jgi:ribosomal protein L37E
MNGSPVSISRHTEPLGCARCGTAWHLKLGLCVSCLLSCGLDAEIDNRQTLDDVLAQIDMSDAD